MAFLQKYLITQRHLPQPSARRRGYPMSPGVRFVVAHDTGNANSTAAHNAAYIARTANPTNSEISAAHFFVDDTHIIECVPVLNGTPEKAWHVLSTAQSNNRLFGFHANDAAVGIEYCFGTNIHADQAYRRYVWLIAYVCHQIQLDPSTAVVGHFMLDPHRKTDPVTGLAHSRRNYEQLLRDVVSEHAAYSGTALPAVAPSAVSTRAGSLRAMVHLHIRHGSPNTIGRCMRHCRGGRQARLCRQRQRWGVCQRQHDMVQEQAGKLFLEGWYCFSRNCIRKMIAVVMLLMMNDNCLLLLCVPRPRANRIVIRAPDKSMPGKGSGEACSIVQQPIRFNYC